MYYVEAQISSQFTGINPDLYGRYSDDCIYLNANNWTPSPLCDPTLEFSCILSESSDEFLDKSVTIHQSALTTSLRYYKHTIRHWIGGHLLILVASIVYV